MRDRKDRSEWINVECKRCHLVNEYLKGLPFRQACRQCGAVLVA